MTPEYPIKRRCDVTAAEEWRHGPEAPWTAANRGRGAFATTARLWVEVRPKHLPDPEWHSELHDHKFIVTTVGEMRDRTDLDQWEYAEPWPSEWRILGVALNGPDDYPVIVRRKADR